MRLQREHSKKRAKEESTFHEDPVQALSFPAGHMVSLRGREISAVVIDHDRNMVVSVLQEDGTLERVHILQLQDMKDLHGPGLHYLAPGDDVKVKLEVSRDLKTFQVQNAAGDTQETHVLDSENVSDVCQRILRLKLAKYLIDFEQRADKLVEELMAKSMFDAFGFEPDKWNHGHVVLKKDGVAEHTLQARAKPLMEKFMSNGKIARLIDEHAAGFETAAVDFMTKKFFSNMDYKIERMLSGLLEEKLKAHTERIVDEVMGAATSTTKFK